MKDYIKVSNEKGYQFLNSGALLLVSTIGLDEKYDIAPIAWYCPIDYDKFTRLLIVCDKKHHTLKNIQDTKQFAISVPDISQLQVVKDTGSCSGRDTDKIAKFNINVFDSEVVKVKLPVGAIAYIECKVYNIIFDGEVALIFGETVFVKADREAYNNRLLSETEAAKTIHHLGGKAFITTSDVIIK